MALMGTGCARCGQPYGAQGIRVLAQREEIAFVQLVCEACQIQTLALVTGLPAGRQDDEQLEATAGSPAPGEGLAITEADVVDMRAFLADYRGDIRGLLERGPRRSADDDTGKAR
jgi:hypothetical protein